MMKIAAWAGRRCSGVGRIVPSKWTLRPLSRSDPGSGLAYLRQRFVRRRHLGWTASEPPYFIVLNDGAQPGRPAAADRGAAHAGQSWTCGWCSTAPPSATGSAWAESRAANGLGRGREDRGADQGRAATDQQPADRQGGRSCGKNSSRKRRTQARKFSRSSLRVRLSAWTLLADANRPRTALTSRKAVGAITGQGIAADGADAPRRVGARARIMEAPNARDRLQSGNTTRRTPARSGFSPRRTVPDGWPLHHDWR